MRPLTETERKRFERKAYKALDAIDCLVGEGLGGEKTERALSAIREIINDIDNAPAKERKRGARNRT
jgi:NAD(P)H-hydrate repair Nnr-like enzyme with NAD(P)H-hydrate epimerase domain